jgi:hypothetical protein
LWVLIYEVAGIAEIYYFDVEFWIQQYVFGFDITVCDASAVDMT